LLALNPSCGLFDTVTGDGGCVHLTSSRSPRSWSGGATYGCGKRPAGSHPLFRIVI